MPREAPLSCGRRIRPDCVCFGLLVLAAAIAAGVVAGSHAPLAPTLRASDADVLIASPEVPMPTSRMWLLRLSAAAADPVQRSALASAARRADCGDTTDVVVDLASEMASPTGVRFGGANFFSGVFITGQACGRVHVLVPPTAAATERSFLIAVSSATVRGGIVVNSSALGGRPNHLALFLLVHDSNVNFDATAAPVDRNALHHHGVGIYVDGWNAASERASLNIAVTGGTVVNVTGGPSAQSASRLLSVAPPPPTSAAAANYSFPTRHVGILVANSWVLAQYWQGSDVSAFLVDACALCVAGYGGVHDVFIEVDSAAIDLTSTSVSRVLDVQAFHGRITGYMIGRVSRSTVVATTNRDRDDDDGFGIVARMASFGRFVVNTTESIVGGDAASSLPTNFSVRVDEGSSIRIANAYSASSEFRSLSPTASQLLFIADASGDATSTTSPAPTMFAPGSYVLVRVIDAAVRVVSSHSMNIKTSVNMVSPIDCIAITGTLVEPRAVVVLVANSTVSVYQRLSTRATGNGHHEGRVHIVALRGAVRTAGEFVVALIRGSDVDATTECYSRFAHLAGSSMLNTGSCEQRVVELMLDELTVVRGGHGRLLIDGSRVYAQLYRAGTGRGIDRLDGNILIAYVHGLGHGCHGSCKQGNYTVLVTCSSLIAKPLTPAEGQDAAAITATSYAGRSRVLAFSSLGQAADVINFAVVGSTVVAETASTSSNSLWDAAVLANAKPQYSNVKTRLITLLIRNSSIVCNATTGSATVMAFVERGNGMFAFADAALHFAIDGASRITLLCEKRGVLAAAGKAVSAMGGLSMSIREGSSVSMHVTNAQASQTQALLSVDGHIRCGAGDVGFSVSDSTVTAHVVARTADATLLVAAGSNDLTAVRFTRLLNDSRVLVSLQQSVYGSYNVRASPDVEVFAIRTWALVRAGSRLVFTGSDLRVSMASSAGGESSVIAGTASVASMPNGVTTTSFGPHLIVITRTNITFTGSVAANPRRDGSSRLDVRLVSPGRVDYQKPANTTILITDGSRVTSTLTVRIGSMNGGRNPVTTEGGVIALSFDSTAVGDQQHPRIAVPIVVDGGSRFEVATDCNTSTDVRWSNECQDRVFPTNRGRNVTVGPHSGMAFKSTGGVDVRQPSSIGIAPGGAVQQDGVPANETRVISVDAAAAHSAAMRGHIAETMASFPDDESPAQIATDCTQPWVRPASSSQHAARGSASHTLESTMTGTGAFVVSLSRTHPRRGDIPAARGFSVSPSNVVVSSSIPRSKAMADATASPTQRDARRPSSTATGGDAGDRSAHSVTGSVNDAAAKLVDAFREGAPVAVRAATTAVVVVTSVLAPGAAATRAPRIASSAAMVVCGGDSEAVEHPSRVEYPLAFDVDAAATAPESSAEDAVAALRLLAGGAITNAACAAAASAINEALYRRRRRQTAASSSSYAALSVAAVVPLLVPGVLGALPALTLHGGATAVAAVIAATSVGLGGAAFAIVVVRVRQSTTEVCAATRVHSCDRHYGVFSADVVDGARVLHTMAWVVEVAATLLFSFAVGLAPTVGCMTSAVLQTSVAAALTAYFALVRPMSIPAEAVAALANAVILVMTGSAAVAAAAIARSSEGALPEWAESVAFVSAVLQACLACLMCLHQLWRRVQELLKARRPGIDADEAAGSSEPLLVITAVPTTGGQPEAAQTDPHDDSTAAADGTTRPIIAVATNPLDRPSHAAQ